MSDQQELFCLNPDCGEVIQKNKKGVYPKQCVECDQPVPEITKPETFKCPHCDEVLNKNKRGVYPKTCPECDKPTNPFQALKTDVVRCPSSACGEEIKKNSKGKYPRFCAECGTPVIVPSSEPLQCPECQEERPKSSKSGKLANVCPQCGYSYKMGATMSQSMMSSLPSQTDSLVNVYSSPDHSLSPGSSTRPMTPTSPHRGDNLSQASVSPGGQPQLPSDTRPVLPTVHHTTVIEPGSDATHSTLSQVQEADQQKTENDPPSSTTLSGDGPHRVDESHGPHNVDESHDMLESWCMVDKDSLNKELATKDVQQTGKRPLQTASDTEQSVAKSQKLLVDRNHESLLQSPSNQQPSNQSPPNQQPSNQSPLNQQPSGQSVPLTTQAKPNFVPYQPRSNPHRMSATDPHQAGSLRGPDEEGQGEHCTPPDDRMATTDRSLANRMQEAKPGALTEDPNYTRPSIGADGDVSGAWVLAGGKDNKAGESNSQNGQSARHSQHSTPIARSQSQHNHPLMRSDDKFSKTFPPRSDQALDSMELSFSLGPTSFQDHMNSAQNMGADGCGKFNHQGQPSTSPFNSSQVQDVHPDYETGENFQGHLPGVAATQQPLQRPGDNKDQAFPTVEVGTVGESITGLKIWSNTASESSPGEGGSTAIVQPLRDIEVAEGTHQTTIRNRDAPPSDAGDGHHLPHSDGRDQQLVRQQCDNRQALLTQSLPSYGDHTEQNQTQSLQYPKHENEQHFRGTAVRDNEGQDECHNRVVTADGKDIQIEIKHLQGGPSDGTENVAEEGGGWRPGVRQDDVSRQQLPGVECTGPQKAQGRSAFGPDSTPEGQMAYPRTRMDESVAANNNSQKGEHPLVSKESDVNGYSDDEYTNEGSSVDPVVVQRGAEEELAGGPASGTRSKTAANANSSTAEISGETTKPLQENQVAELDVVALFTEMKDKMELANRALMNKPVLKKKVGNNLEEVLHKLVSQAKKKMADYEAKLKSQPNRKSESKSFAIEAAENGMRKFFSANARDVNSILKKLEIPQLPMEELPAHKNKNRKPQPPAPTNTKLKHCIKVTFKAVLANVFLEAFDGQHPIVQIMSDVDNFEKPLVTLQKGTNGIWSGIWNAFDMSCRLIQYKYFVHDGSQALEDGWEWLGQASYPKRVINRYLFLPGNEKEIIVYDGIVQPKTESSRFAKLKSFILGDSGVKEQEQERGLWAMMPNWNEEIKSGTSVEALIEWILQVVNRQTECLSRFASYTREVDYTRTKFANSLVHKVFAEYVEEAFKSQDLLACSPDVCSSFASLVGLLHVARHTLKRSEYSTIRRLAHHVPQIVKETMARATDHLAVLDSKESFTDALLAKLGGDGQFVKAVQKSLIATISTIESRSGNDYTWIMLLPLVHLLAPTIDSGLDNRGENVDTKLWWGVADIDSHVQTLKRSYSDENYWKTWIRWLSPYFTIDPILPYTFLALLTERQLLSLLNSDDTVAVGQLPLDGLLACVRYHLNSSYSHQMGNYLDALYHLMLKLKSRQSRFTIPPRSICQSLAKDLLHLVLPPQSWSVKQEFISTVQIYLFVMEEVFVIDEKATISSLGADLVFYSDRVVSILGKQKQDAWGRSVAYAYISSDEMEIWIKLFKCSSDNHQLAEWWLEKCKTTFKNRIEKLADITPMAVVDLYCNRTFDIPAMEETVADSAFPKAELILKEGSSSSWYTMPDKIGKLVDQALNKAWDTNDESPQNIVKNMVKWGNFLAVWKFYKGLSNTQRHKISQDTEVRLYRSATSMDGVLNNVISGQITFGDFAFLYENKNKVIQLCEVSDSFKDKAGLISDTFERRAVEKKAFGEFHKLLGDFLSFSEDSMKEKTHLQQWMKRRVDHLMFHNNLTPEAPYVVCPHLSAELAQILKPFQENKQRPIFLRTFQHKLKEIHQGSSDDILKAYHSAVGHHDLIKARLAEGNLSMESLEQLMRRYFNGSIERFTDELKHMVDSNIFKARKRQIELCSHLDQYHSGARVMLDMQELFGLTGDFSDMKKILESANKQLELKDISEELLTSASSIRHITRKQISCLEAFVDCKDFVDWIRDEVPKKDISNFVDLASSTGEDDLAAHKTRYLLNALTGYTPLLYDFDKDETDYNSFIELCKRVWETMTQNEELEQNLRKSAADLEWVKKVKTHFGNVEIKSMAQATAINETGVYHVGNIKGHSKDFKSLEDVMLLECTVEEKGEMKMKKYTYFDLKELQSKLTLVAGEQQKENRDTILKFDAMRDAVENLAKAYIDIRREGCIQFDDMLVVVHCRPENVVGIEVRLQSINKVLNGKNKEKKRGALEHCQDLYTYMNNCVTKWRDSMDEYRSEHTELNFYTTEQLVVLRKELGTFLDSENSGCLKQALPLLAMIDTVDPGLLLQYITEFSKISALKEDTKDEEEMDSSKKAFLPYNQMSNSQQNLVDELQEEHESFTELLAVQAVNELGETAEFDCFIEWIEKHVRDLEVAAEAAQQSGSNSLQTSADLMRKLMEEEPKDSGLQAQLNTLWTGFIEMTSQSIKDFLSITHLGYVLRKTYEGKRRSHSKRRLPSWLSRGKPCLIATPLSQAYQMVLTIYECDSTYPSPTRNEVLICNKKTRSEEVSLFLNRALNDPLSFYCMVNCHLLDYEVCRVIENRLSNTADDKVKDYGLAFIYAEEKRDARIRAYLDKHLVKNPEFTDYPCLSEYVLQILSVPNEVVKTACSVDESRSFARLIRSSRAGVGKSLHKNDLVESLRKDRRLRGVDITIPIYKTVNTDHIINILTSELGNGYTDTPHNTIHIDIAHEVESGADELLFNLIILRSIVNSEGVVWQAQNTQYYIIECMPYTRTDGSSAHEVMNMLPTRTCRTPEEVCQVYAAGDSLPTGFIGFNKAVLMAKEWQTVLKYLDCHARNDRKYETSDKPFDSPLAALRLLIGNCGLKDPAWSELRHYVYFLSSQLFKVEKSPFCFISMAEDLPGFRTFVIQFMFRMAKDFATRSLKIAEETPGLDLNQSVQTGKENVLNQLEIHEKRKWESGNHPYLFFNEDGATFTPLGFFVRAVHGAGQSLSLVDCQTEAVLEPKCIGKELKRALDQYQLSMSEDFNGLSRGAQLDKLRNVMVKTVKLSRAIVGNDGTVVYNPEEMFRNHDDPDPNYVLTMDNAKKILAIHQRLRVDIPVIIMGETGCGKTKLIDFMSKLQVPTALKDQINTMIIVKIHGGTTEEDIIQKVSEAQALAVTNQQICANYAAEFDSNQVPTVYTILFLDEANTTEAIGLVKEILCDGRMRGKPLKKDSGLKIIAACNPYRKHSEAMIEKLKKAGLGYNVDESETKDKFGQIPMRHLVYRVQALSQSLLPLVWDFGTLRSAAPQKGAGPPVGDIESAYIRQMIVKFNQTSRNNPEGLNFGYHTAIMADILASTQAFMREQKDECSFVSLRDIQRLLDVAGWFYSQRNHLFRAIDNLAIADDNPDLDPEGDDEQTGHQAAVVDFNKDYTIRSLILGLGVCYLARLEDKTRLDYAKFINNKIEGLIGGAKEINNYRMSGSEFLFHQIELCQDMFINEVVNTELHKNIAKNKALKENVFMMIVCIENRIPLFLVGKPGSSKSLSKSMVVDAMKGKRSESKVFKEMKQSYMVSFQCSRHATPAGIVGVFNHCANFQEEQDLSAFVSVVVLDEVGLAEDSENMPLKTLHPLLEDGCEDSSIKPEPYMKCAFVGISNWALDPAKMNRGIFVQRGTPHPNELEQIAKEICRSSETGDNDVGPFIKPLANGYLDICAKKKPDERDLTEFFGLRDFYSLMKMVVNFAQSTGSLNRNQLEHSIRRNFGGFDPDVFDPMDVFRDHCNMESIQPQEDGRPPIDSIGLIQSSLSGEDTALQGMESRYLLILTENLSVLSIILAEFDSKGLHPEVVFGSKFRDDVSYTQVCHNIYRIKTCMDMGKPVILLNLDDLYESLYDALNQYFSTWGDRKFVDLGLGTHRVKTFVDEEFRLVVIADKNKVHSQFPIPLINRLEKHYVSATSLLTEEQKQVKAELEKWAKKFVTPQRHFSNVCPSLCEACKTDLTKPYKLSCGHYIGFCCKERIVNEELDRKCPVKDCGEAIHLEEWVIDTAALENRQYFENSTTETAFIGYSTETTALAVRKSSEEFPEDVDYGQLLNCSKFHLLQCATGESVLRLNKTELAHEAKKIQNMYMEEQHHETLLQYLQHELPKASDSSLFIQVTSFAELMNVADIRSLRSSLDQSGLSLEVFNMFLKDFVKEDQFTETVRSHYENTEHKCRLMLIQCESATENIELLDSVRFIIQRESEAALRLLGEEAPQTHTVLLLNLPRGDTFTGFQGGKWKCVHIDDPKSPQIKLPSLSKCLNLNPSDIIEKVMKKLLPDPDPSAPVEEIDDDDDDGIMVIKEGDQPEEGTEDVTNSKLIADADDTMFDEMLPFILQCLPAAVSGIKSDHDYDRVALLKKLLTKYEDVAGIFLRHVHSLLKKQEEFNITHWVMADAAKASNMKQSETMRHSLEDALERAFVPALAAVISFIDVRLNLCILDQQSDLRSLWLRIFADCHKLGLKFSTITKQNKADTNRAKLPQQYKIQEVGSGQQKFGTRLPFSWIIKDTIDSLMDASSNLEFGDGVDSLIEQFKMSPIGRIIHIDQYMKRHMEILDLFITDFVYMAHPCTNKTEHKIVGLCLMKYLQRSMTQDLNLVHVNLAYKQQKVMFDNLTAIFGLVDTESQLFEAVGKQIELVMKNNEESLPCDLLALQHLVKSIWEIKANELLLNPEGWVDEVEKCKQVVTQVLNSRDDQEEEFTAECRVAWLRLDVKKLYVEHIIVPSPVVKKTGKREPHKLAFFTRVVTGTSFQSYETFQQVIKFLREAVAERVRSLYSKCPKICPLCEKPLDSPVKLPCQHFLCEACVEETHICSVDNCGKEIPKPYHYDPAKDRIDEEQLQLFRDLRKRMNKFFMTFVSDIVFHGDEDPDEEIIKWLVDCVTGRDGETTRQFSLFNSAEVVDPTPVIRSFLLKLLLTCARDQFVSRYLDQTLGVAALDKSRQLQTMVLLMDCRKDIFGHQFIQDADMLAGVLGDYTDVVTRVDARPSVVILTDLADVQCCISQSLESILASGSTTAIKQLEEALKAFLEQSKQAENAQPGYLIARQLLVTHGESYIKDLVNTPRNFLVPDDVKDALESFTVPDVLSAFGGKRYKQAKSDLDKTIAETYPGDRFTNALNQFKQTCQNEEGLMLMVMFTRVTRTFVQRIPVAQQTRDGLMAALKHGMTRSHSKTLLEMLLQDGRLPREMDVNQSSGINLSMLVLNLYSCLCSGGVMADLYPLSEIINQPDQAAIHFLPTMADNQVELMQEVIKGALTDKTDYNVTTYQCPNGHPYFIGNCGRPVERVQCKMNGCGAYIGSTGQYNHAAEGNTQINAGDRGAKTQPGHILGAATNNSQAIRERDLDPLSCSVLRCLTHLCMYMSTLFNIQQVHGMVHPNLPRVEDVRPFLEAHIQLGLQQISQCCAESTDDCILLIHDVISRMKQASRKGNNSVLDSIAQRKTWEQRFDTQYIKPSIKQKTQQITSIKEKLKSADSVDIKRLLTTSDKPINDENIVASAGLWSYRRPLTLAAVQNMLGSTVKNCPRLKDIADNCHVLMAVKHLPDVLTLIKSLNDKFHSRFSRAETSKMRIGDFCRRHEGEIPTIKKLVDSFNYSWNTIYKMLGEVGGKAPKELHMGSPLSQFLIDQQCHTESTPFMLVAVLTDIHNLRLAFTDEPRPKVALSAVTPTNIIGIENSDEILSLIASHSEYELRETTAITYNWPAIEREVLHRYISNKPRIEFSRDQLPCYVYQEDFNLHNQMQAISDSQEMLSPDLQASIIKMLSIQVQTLTQNLKELKVVINFMSVMRHIERDQPLLEYMEATFGREPNYLSKDIKLKHVIHVWLVVKYTQTDLLMRKHQEPFDDIDAECRENLSQELKTELNAHCQFNSPRTKQLLQELFKYIILRLNKAAVQQDPVNPDQSLQDALTEFITYRTNEDDEERVFELLASLPNIPEDVQVKHVSKAWSYIWTRFTTKVE